jgi:hypothetical protein
MTDLRNKTVFITGASSGIGEEIAYEAARKGAIVLLSARRVEKLEKVKETCQKLSNDKAYVFPLDITDPEAIEKVIKEAIEKVGTIDVLVNNAGLGYTEEFLSFDMERAETIFRINVLGLMYVTQLVALHMAEKKTGHIFNVASIAGKIATPKTAVYSASKFAVIGFSNALRLELKPLNIQVTTVNPGPVETAFFDSFDPDREYLESIKHFVLTPEKVASKTIKAIGTSKREINLPLILEGASRFYHLFPSFSDFLTRTIFNKK